jgi:hypothetical protein
MSGVAPDSCANRASASDPSDQSLLAGAKAVQSTVCIRCATADAFARAWSAPSPARRSSMKNCGPDDAITVAGMRERSRDTHAAK